ALAEAETDTRQEKPARASHQRVGRGGDAPGGDRDRVAHFGSEAIDEPPESEKADGVRPLKGRVDLPELLVGPMELFVEDWLQKRQDLTIDVVDGGGEKEQRADYPAVP